MARCTVPCSVYVPSGGYRSGSRGFSVSVAPAVPANALASGRRMVRCFAKNRKKKERKYGEGREQIGSSVTESLHFGRLIGETAKDTAERLEGSGTEDARAKLYLEKWEQEEDASYSMFESLLNGKPLDDRSKKMKELEFESILELSTDDEVFQEYELVLSSTDDIDDVDVAVGGGSGGASRKAEASKVCYSDLLIDRSGDSPVGVARRQRAGHERGAYHGGGASAASARPQSCG